MGMTFYDLERYSNIGRFSSRRRGSLKKWSCDGGRQEGKARRCEACSHMGNGILYLRPYELVRDTNT